MKLNQGSNKTAVKELVGTGRSDEAVADKVKLMLRDLIKTRVK